MGFNSGFKGLIPGSINERSKLIDTGGFITHTLVMH